MGTLHHCKPTIDLWYGHHQTFGLAGQPQRWVNILGRVRSPIPISLLVYSLNGAPPQPLSLGPDRRRLVGRGDFNLDLDIRQLIEGANQIVLTATDEDGLQPPSK